MEIISITINVIHMIAYSLNINIVKACLNDSNKRSKLV